MKLQSLKGLLPSWKNTLLAAVSAVLLILAFPDFEFWFLAWFALVPLLFAVERETESGHSCPHEPEGRTASHLIKDIFRTLSRSCGQECPRSFVLGWIFGNIFFFGTCWWLTFAPITYAAFPPVLAYFLLFCVTSVAAVFPGLFAAILSIRIRHIGFISFAEAPFIWVATEFLRYWLTGNNWNAFGYSQVFLAPFTGLAAYGGVYLVSFAVIGISTLLATWCLWFRNQGVVKLASVIFLGSFLFLALMIYVLTSLVSSQSETPILANSPIVVAIQPNVPMSGLTLEKWRQLRQRQVELAENALASINQNPQSAIRNPQSVVILPESPMNFAYDEDPEFQTFIHAFARRNNVNVLFNSAEPNHADGKYFNSAVMVGPEGREVAQYDKIYLLPFGEAVPFPLEGILPGFVGNFSYGNEYDLLPLGDAKAGVMICFESHFGQLSREYVRNGADVIIEMTNDGYLGPTPVLRQHLANAVFRAVETNRPVLRVTNVGITAYINERGEVLDTAPPYQEDTRIWSMSKSDGSQTFYVKYGDWFAWLCSVVTVGLLIFGFLRKRADRAETRV